MVPAIFSFLTVSLGDVVDEFHGRPNFSFLVFQILFEA